MTDDKAYDGHHQVSIDKAWQLEHDDMFGRGAGDGDLYGYPGQAEAEALDAKRLASKATPTFQYPVEPVDFPGKLYPMWALSGDADNQASSAEQAGWDNQFNVGA